MEIKAEILKMIQRKDSDLPTLPMVIDRIISAASDKKTTTEDLAEVIAYDQGMTNKLLRLANSIYYAQKTKGKPLNDPFRLSALMRSSVSPWGWASCLPLRTNQV